VHSIDNALPQPKDRAMHTQAQTKIVAFALAALTSVSLLGATIGGMQPRIQADVQLIALDTVTITAPARAAN
jgi:hypothetical protein